MRAVTQNCSDIKSFLQALKCGCMLVDDSDVVLLISQVLGERTADLTRSEDNDFHRSVDPLNDPATP
jgi:hypothetical protein